MGTFSGLAAAYRYPAPGRVDELSEWASGMQGRPARPFRSFVAAVGALDLASWEELHTRTCDLSPLFVPYVGHVAYGEDYRRGAFMAALNRAQRAAGIDQDGELPDHLIPVLRYLDTSPEPLPELIDTFEAAVRRMLADLRDAEAANPYVKLLEATLAASGLLAEPPGGKR